MKSSYELKLFVLLILANFFWGGTFCVVKMSVADMDFYSFIFFRFLIASLILAVVYRKEIIQMNRVDFSAGIFVGTSMVAGYIFQTAGLQYTTASKAGFIMILSIILVPFLSRMFLKEKIDRHTFAGFICAVAGLILMTVKKDLSMGQGDILVMFSAVSFALQIVFVSIAMKQVRNISAFTFVELFYVALFAGLMAWSEKDFQLPQTVTAYTGIILTAVFATSFGFIVQGKAQSVISPTKAALTYATEPVFAAVLGYFVLGELFSFKEFIGALFIFAGMIAGEEHLYKQIKKSIC